MATSLSEQTFVPDEFRSSHVMTGLIAKAKRLQTLLVMEPGTIPNLVEAGIGIGTFIGEFADDMTLDAITERTKAQIDKYLPDENVKDIEFRFIESKEDGRKMLAIFFSLYTDENFAMTIKRDGMNPESSRLVSDFYF